LTHTRFHLDDGHAKPHPPHGFRPNGAATIIAHAPNHQEDTMSALFRAPLMGSLLAVSMAACSSTPAGDGAPATPADAMAGCNADAAQSAVGKQATADVVEQARKVAGAQVARTLKPGQMVTMEFREGRLNLQVDDNNVVTEVRCG
jgi:hypothetical protein